jgi:hypothetical protein
MGWLQSQSQLTNHLWHRTKARRQAPSCLLALMRTAAWAHDLLPLGKIPFYGHNADNLASQGVARSLRLLPFIDGVGYA